MDGNRGAKGSIKDRLISLLYRIRYAKKIKKEEEYEIAKKEKQVEYLKKLLEVQEKDNVDILDVDNDGVMEVLVEIPHATGDSTVSLLKYINGKLTGKTKIECSLLD